MKKHIGKLVTAAFTAAALTFSSSCINEETAIAECKRAGWTNISYHSSPTYSDCEPGERAFIIHGTSPYSGTGNVTVCCEYNCRVLYSTFQSD